MSKEEFVISESSGNVFEDLGLANSDCLLKKADLAAALLQELKSRRLNQTQAAELLETTQPKMSLLYNARLRSITYDLLFRWLERVGKEVSFSIHDSESTLYSRGYG
jgi:predicted XRE-type DNA-binding protein